MDSVSISSLFEWLCLALLCSMLCAAFVWLHSIPDAGHKRDLSVGAFTLGIFTLSALFYAWDIVEGVQGTGHIIHWISGAAAVHSFFYWGGRIGHIAITLRRSEQLERITKNKRGDDPMTNEMLSFASTAIRQGLEEVRDRYANRGKGCPSTLHTSPLPSPALAHSSPSGE